MAEQGATILSTLCRSWSRYRVLRDLLYTLAICAVVSVFVRHFFGLPVWITVVVCLFVLSAWWMLRKPWKTNPQLLSRWLDQQYPLLEESSQLLLLVPAQKSTLQQLQYQRTLQALEQINDPLQIKRRLRWPIGISVIAVAASLVFTRLSFTANNSKSPAPSTIASGKLPEKRPPEIARVQLSIQPPGYTQRPVREQRELSVRAETGSVLHWTIHSNRPIAQLQIAFNGQKPLAMHPSTKDSLQWEYTYTTDSSGFYQLLVAGKPSDLYQLDIIPDLVPKITVSSPGAVTIIDYGEPPIVAIAATISDDYALQDAAIVATIASGSGEAVKFKETLLPAAGFKQGSRVFELRQRLSLQQLGMQPGDELYFYIRANDSRRQESRSDVLIARLTDTAQLMSIDGFANTLNLKPDYFRSQRQIIIETEQLLRDKGAIGTDSFNNKSNSLGTDQKLLRLRYGKFLGDEAESGDEHGDELDNPADFSNADKVRDAFTDKHDNAEDATFYDPETKKQLRAVLGQMWDAELKLRLFTPQEALPFEYKALRLLKDLQQQSRVYVAKASFKVHPPDPSKRLSGDLSKIDLPYIKKQSPAPTDPNEAGRMALSILSDSANTWKSEEPVLREALQLVEQAAIKNPARYLNALSAFRRLMNTTEPNNIHAADIILVQQCLQQVLPKPQRQPSIRMAPVRTETSNQYFRKLQEAKL